MENIVLTQLSIPEVRQIFRQELKAFFSENHSYLSLSDTDPDQPLTIQEASTFTNLAVPTIYSLVSRKEIPFFKRKGSKRLYFLKSDLRKWLLKERQKTASEIADDAIGSVRIKKKRG